jgi:hypothetical protein
VGNLVNFVDFMVNCDVCSAQLVNVIALVILNIGSAHCLTAE